jgi:hypothetical protein
MAHHMLRQARLDSPELLHHVMIRGIERRVSFNEDRGSWAHRRGRRELRDKKNGVSVTNCETGAVAVG